MGFEEIRDRENLHFFIIKWYLGHKDSSGNDYEVLCDYHRHIEKICKILQLGARESAQWLRALTALKEDSGSISSHQ